MNHSKIRTYMNVDRNDDDRKIAISLKCEHIFSQEPRDLYIGSHASWVAYALYYFILSVILLNISNIFLHGIQ